MGVAGGHCTTIPSTPTGIGFSPMIAFPAWGCIPLAFRHVLTAVACGG